MKKYLYVSYIREYGKQHDNNDFELIKENARSIWLEDLLYKKCELFAEVKYWN